MCRADTPQRGQMVAANKTNADAEILYAVLKANAHVKADAARTAAVPAGRTDAAKHAIAHLSKQRQIG